MADRRHHSRSPSHNRGDSQSQEVLEQHNQSLNSSPGSARHRSLIGMGINPAEFGNTDRNIRENSETSTNVDNINTTRRNMLHQLNNRSEQERHSIYQAWIDRYFPEGNAGRPQELTRMENNLGYRSMQNQIRGMNEQEARPIYQTWIDRYYPEGNAERPQQLTRMRTHFDYRSMQNQVRDMNEQEARPIYQAWIDRYCPEGNGARPTRLRDMEIYFENLSYDNMQNQIHGMNEQESRPIYQTWIDRYYPEGNAERIKELRHMETRLSYNNMLNKICDKNKQEAHSIYQAWIDRYYPEGNERRTKESRIMDAYLLEQPQRCVYSRIINNLRIDYKKNINTYEEIIIQRYIKKMLAIDINSNTHPIREALANIYEDIHLMEIKNTTVNNTHWKKVKKSIEAIIKSSIDSKSPEIRQAVYNFILETGTDFFRNTTMRSLKRPFESISQP